MPLLQQTRFFTTAAAWPDLPRLGLPEVAFAGRSNAGKSTALNTLAQQKRLAFASKTPGRTQHLNFFAVGRHPEEESLPGGFLVDLPGYGYAEVAKSERKGWGQLLGRYVRERNELTGLVLVMDARRPMTDLDVELVAWFAATGKPIHALLTKADKLNRSEAALTLRQTRAALAAWHPGHTAQLFSSLKRTGVEEASAWVLGQLGLAEPERNNRHPDASVSAQKNAPTQGE